MGSDGDPSAAAGDPPKKKGLTFDSVQDSDCLLILSKPSRHQKSWGDSPAPPTALAGTMRITKEV
jgi:hypothetical protein